MYVPVRRSLGIVLGILALSGPFSARSQAQLLAPFGMGLNPYINPMVGGGLGFGGTGFGGMQFSASAGASFGTGFGSFSGLGYGNLMPGGGWGGGGYGGYGGMNGGLGANALSGALLGAGYGYGMGLGNVQWMMNPYQGYLSGAASVTRANAEYWQGIAQARLTRQEAIRSSILTRRAFIEEAEWERQHMPDPEQIRQKALERELNRARNTPPLQDVWDASALNALLRYLIAQQGLGMKGPNIPLSEDTLDHINPTVGGTRANIGLLRNNAELLWPLSLQRELFKEPREKINSLMRDAYKSAANGNKPDNATISDLRHNYNKLKETLSSNVDQLTPDEYIEANKYVNDVNRAIDALKSASVSRFLDGSWKTKVHNVAELVQFMRENGLWFAEATPRDRAAYVSLYNSLASFDRGMQRFARENSSGESEK